MTQFNDMAMQASALSAKLAPQLAGHPPVIQGAALADLVAIWLAGHWCEGEAERRNLRETLLALHVDKVRLLIPVNEELGERGMKE